MPQADADAADRAHPPENLNFTVVFSPDQSIDDKDPRLHDAFEHLGLRQRIFFCDVCYAVRVPRSQLMMPPVPHLHGTGLILATIYNQTVAIFSFISKPRGWTCTLSVICQETWRMLRSYIKTSWQLELEWREVWPKNIWEKHLGEGGGKTRKKHIVTIFSGMYANSS